MIVTFWDVVHRDPLKRFSMGLDLTTALDISYDGDFIGAGFHNGNIKIWRIISASNYTKYTDSINQGQSQAKHSYFSPLENEYNLAHPGCVTCIKFSPCGNFIATASTDGKLFLWEIEDKKSVEFSGHRGGISCLCFSQPNNFLISADTNGLVIIWDISSTQDKIEEIQMHDQIILSLAVSPCENYIAVGGIYGSIKLYDIPHKKMLKELKFHSKGVNSIQFLNNKMQILISSSTDATLKFVYI